MFDYIVTGTFPNGKRFKAMIYSKQAYAMAINLYRGHVWERNIHTGKRRCIKSVYN